MPTSLQPSLNRSFFEARACARRAIQEFPSQRAGTFLLFLHFLLCVRSAAEFPESFTLLKYHFFHVVSATIIGQHIMIGINRSRLLRPHFLYLPVSHDRSIDSASILHHLMPPPAFMNIWYFYRWFNNILSPRKPRLDCRRLHFHTAHIVI